MGTCPETLIDPRVVHCLNSPRMSAFFRCSMNTGVGLDERVRGSPLSFLSLVTGDFQLENDARFPFTFSSAFRDR